MACDDSRTIIGDYLFERHEGVIMCYPFTNDDGDFDISKKLDYAPCDNISDLDDVFKSFREDYKKFDPDDRMGFRVALTIEEWFEFFDLALHESVHLISVDRLYHEGEKLSWHRIQDMITPVSQKVIDVLNCIDDQYTDTLKRYNIGVIESDDELIITSVLKLSLIELNELSDVLRDFDLVKLDNNGYIKYYIFKLRTEDWLKLF